MATVTQTQVVPESWTITTNTTAGQLITTTNTTTTQQRSGIETWITTSQSTATTSKSQSSSEPFMRERDVVIVGTGLKPYTNVNLFLRGSNVNSKFIPALTVSYGGSEVNTEVFNIHGNITITDNAIKSVFPAPVVTVPTTVAGTTSNNTTTNTTTTTSTTTQSNIKNYNVLNSVITSLTPSYTLNGKTWCWVEIRNKSNQLLCLLGLSTSGNTIQATKIICNPAAMVFDEQGTDLATTAKISTLSLGNIWHLTNGGFTKMTSGQYTVNTSLFAKDLRRIINSITSKTPSKYVTTTATDLFVTTQVDTTNASVSPSGQTVPTPIAISTTVTPAVTPITNVVQTNTNYHNTIEYGVSADIQNSSGTVVGSCIVIGQTYEELSTGAANTLKLLMPSVMPQTGYKIVAKDGSAKITVATCVDTGLKTNSLGDLYGALHIDAGTWPTGSSDIYISDREYPMHPAEMTSASATYTTKGTLIESWNVYTTTYNTQVNTKALSESRTTGTTTSTNVTTTTPSSSSSVVTNVNPNPPAPPPVRSDPLAQSFYVNEVNGCFLTSLTLYFYFVETQYPVFVELRDMVNGYPGPNILAGGQTFLMGNNIPFSLTTKVPATFTFDNPIYVNGKTDYCFVIRTESNQTQVWTSKVGDKRIDSPAYVAEQPSLGAMFKSQNNATWVPDDWSDITFKLEKAKFNTALEGESTFVSSQASWQRLEVNPFMIKHGKNTALVFHPNHGHEVTDWVSIKNSDDTMGTSGTSLFNGNFQIINCTPDQYEIKVSDANLTVSTGILRVGGAQVEASENKTVNVLQFGGRSFVPSGTEMHFKYDITSDRNLSGEFTPCNFNSDIFLELYHAEMLSKINEEKKIGGKNSVYLKSFMLSTNPDVSPVLDVGSLSVTGVNYNINSPDASYEWDFTEHTILSGQSVTFNNTDKEFSTTNTSLFDEFKQFEIGKSIKITVGATTYPTYVTKTTYDGTTYTVGFNGVTEAATPVEITLNGAQTATISQNDNYIREISPESGSAAFKYVSRVLTFNFDASGFKMWFDYIKPQYSNIDLYYKVSGNEATDMIKMPWTKFNPENKDVLIDTFVPVENEWLIDLDQPFKKLMFKLVMTSQDQAFTPLLRNLRMIALA